MMVHQRGSWMVAWMPRMDPHGPGETAAIGPGGEHLIEVEVIILPDDADPEYYEPVDDSELTEVPDHGQA